MKGLLAERIGRWLTVEWNSPVQVTSVSESTAGARRKNIFLDVLHEGVSQRLVATIVPPELRAPLSVAVEATVRALARQAGVPVPTVRGVCTDVDFVGAPFLISDRVDGETVPRRVHRLVDDFGNSRKVVEQLGEALGHLHAIDIRQAAAALDAATETTPIATAVATCRRRLATMSRPEPALSYVMRWLDDRQPPEPPVSALIHTDARVGNLIVDSRGLRAILDWEGARFGDPMEDLAWPCTRMWRFGRDSATVGGLGDLSVLQHSYGATGGQWDDERFAWWRVCGGLQWALELDSQTQSHLSGTASNVVMAASGRRVAEVAFDLLHLTRADRILRL